MGCVNATLAKRRLNPTYLKLSEEEFIKLNHLIMITNLRPIDIISSCKNSGRSTWTGPAPSPPGNSSTTTRAGTRSSRGER